MPTPEAPHIPTSTPMLQAPAMHWHDGHFWTLDVELPVGTVNFKVIMAQENGYVRWEDGDNRAIDIPAVLPDSETPVGHMDVTCNWNDVSHSQTVARPDRAYLRGKLRAVEAKVMAIQERKKRLDNKMLQLNAGLQVRPGRGMCEWKRGEGGRGGGGRAWTA